MAYAHVMQTHYHSEYERLFGAMPDLSQLPANAGPKGSPAEQAAWAAMDARTQNQVSRIFTNMGKSIAAYEKTLHYGASRFDHYVDGVLNQDPVAMQVLKPQEVNGLRIFVGKAACVACHGGPLLTDHGFHNTGVPPRDITKPDYGRSAALSKVLNDEFNCLGPFSDANDGLQDHCQELRFMVKEDSGMEGAFKTPSLRNVALRPPYMHAGQISTLNDVIHHYITAPKAVVGHSERKSMCRVPSVCKCVL